MRLIRTDKVPDGSTLGRDIITGRDAVPLLRAGVSIDQRYRDALAKAGIHAIYIADEQSEGIVPVPAISDEARLLTTRAVSTAFDEAKRSIATGKSLPTTAANSLTQVVERILLEIEETDIGSLVLNNNSCADAYIIQHAIDVTALGMIIGRRLMGEQGWTDHRGQRQHGKRDERLARLGMGLLLHDIGKLAMPAEILNKPSKLSESEWEVIKNPPTGRTGSDPRHERLVPPGPRGRAAPPRALGRQRLPRRQVRPTTFMRWRGSQQSPTHTSRSHPSAHTRRHARARGGPANPRRRRGAV